MSDGFVASGCNSSGVSGNLLFLETWETGSQNTYELSL